MNTEDRSASSRRRLFQGIGGMSGAALIALLSYRILRDLVYQKHLQIIPCAEWGALAPNHNAPNEHGLFDPEHNPDGWQVYTTPLEHTLTTVVIHHSAIPLSDGPREIQQLHMRNLGFADIGYHFVVDAPGQVYEGRPLNVRGTHTRGHNTGTVGIVLLGNFVVHEPPVQQIKALMTLIIYLRATYQITHLAGHHDFLPTETVCPGANLELRLPDIARDAGLKFGTDGYRKPSYAS